MSTNVVYLNGESYLSMPAMTGPSRDRRFIYPTKNDFTVEAWIRPEAPSLCHIFSNKQIGGVGLAGRGGLIFLVKPDGTLWLVEDNSRAYYLVYSSKTNIFDGNWHHVAGVRKNWGLSLYLNGRPLPLNHGGNGKMESMDIWSGTPMLIGASTSGKSEDFKASIFKGQMSEARIWNYARSEQQIFDNFHHRVSDTESGLIGLWHFEKDCNDSSTTHNSVEITGTPKYVSSNVPLKLETQPLQTLTLPLGADLATDILIKLTKDLLSSAASAAAGDVGSWAVGWVMANMLGIDQNESVETLKKLDELDKHLTDLGKQISDVKASVEKAEKEIKFEVDWKSLVDTLSPHVDNIDFKFQLYTKLKGSSADSTHELMNKILDIDTGVAKSLFEINRLLLDGLGGVDPDAKGILGLWIEGHANKSIDPVVYVRGKFDESSALMQLYPRIENYFAYLLAIQSKGLAMLVDADNAKKDADAAKKAVESFVANFEAQSSLWLHYVAGYVVNYADDETLLGLFSGPNYKLDPILQADAFVVKFRNSLAQGDCLTVRYWFGEGNGLFPFRCGKVISSDEAPQGVGLKDSGNRHIPATDPKGAYSLFPVRNQGQWGVVRYVIPIDTKTDSFVLEPALPASLWNAWIDPSDQDEPFNHGQSKIVISGDQPAAAYYLNLVGVEF